MIIKEGGLYLIRPSTILLGVTEDLPARRNSLQDIHAEGLAAGRYNNNRPLIVEVEHPDVKGNVFFRSLEDNTEGFRTKNGLGYQYDWFKKGRTKFLPKEVFLAKAVPLSRLGKTLFGKGR